MQIYKADSAICYSDKNDKEVCSSLSILQQVMYVYPVCPVHLRRCSVKAEHISLKDFQLLRNLNSHQPDGIPLDETNIIGKLRRNGNTAGKDTAEREEG